MTLDNPVWNALSEAHQQYEIDYDGIKFYQPAFCPFGGFEDAALTQSGIQQYAELTPDFFVVGERPQFGNEVMLNNELICQQMVLDAPIDIELGDDIIKLDTTHHDALFELVSLVQPGYFRKDTALLGDYYGIFKEGELIAATGERMKTHHFTEISAVVTHPEHLKKGYAKRLVACTALHIFNQNKTPYLHVAHSNTVAINLYEKLGFSRRRKISFWHFLKR